MNPFYSPTQNHKAHNIIAILLTLSCFGYAATTTIDFETENAGYSASATEGTGFTDVFNRSNPDVGGNSTYLWAVEDINLSDPSITLDQIDVTGATDFTFPRNFLTVSYNRIINKL